MRSIISVEKRALLCADSDKHRPDIVGLTGTWSDESNNFVAFPGYKLVSRKDRKKDRTSGLNYGGIVMYIRIDGLLVTHLENSQVAERSWPIVHTDVGGILLGLWYRPPDAGAGDIFSFEEDLLRLSTGTIGALIVGDMNIWHKS